MGPGQAAQFRNTQVTCSTPLRAERQKHTNFFRSCLISFPQIKYPILLTLGGSCGMASCSQNIRKHNAKKKKKENTMLLPLSPSFLVHKMSLLLCFPLTSLPWWFGCCLLLPVFVPAGSCCHLFSGKDLSEPGSGLSLSTVFGTSVLPLAFIRDCAAILF